MVEDELEEILVEKGLPDETVGRIEPGNYSSMMREDQSSTSYNPDRVLFKESLDVRDTDLTYVGVDLDEKKVCYYDQFGLPKIGYSGDEFKTSMVIDSHDVSWVVDGVENTSYYFSTDSNEFLPSYNPEIVDPMEFISSIWKETKRQAENSNRFSEGIP